MRKSGDGIENIEARQTLLVVLHCSLKLLVRMNSYKSGFLEPSEVFTGRISATYELRWFGTEKTANSEQLQYLTSLCKYRVRIDQLKM
jgi:hypothetical protein